MRASERARGLLRLTLAPGLGPVRIARLVEAFGDAERVLRASPAELARVRGIGDVTARRAAEGLREAGGLVEEELARIDAAGAHVVAVGEDGYPPLLAQIPGAPPVLTVRGGITPGDRFGVAIVGSRRCTAYGVEQAERFAGVLAGAGITIVSGGARGIDAAAHRGAMRAGGRTIAVLGCGLGVCYPPEHAGLYDEIAGGRGAVVSELPMRTSPDAQNFPARNRIISGMALGVLVIEAGEGSGALITARHAIEDHGREVMAVPGRVDSRASRGALGLIRDGEAALVVDPGEVIQTLERAARHAFEGTHDAVTRDPTRPEQGAGDGDLFDHGGGPAPGLTEPQSALLAALDTERTLDELVATTGLDASAARAELTVLEIQRRVRRSGSRFGRA